MATVSWTMVEDLVVNGVVRAAESSITKASIETDEPMALVDLETVEAADTEGDWVTPVAE